MKNQLLLVLLLLSYSSFAQKRVILMNDKTGWYTIGELTVNQGDEPSEIDILGADRFATLNISALNDTVNLEDVTLYFKEGIQKLHFGKLLVPGTEGTVINFRESDRSLQKISIVGKAMHTSEQETALVQIIGFKPEKK